MTVNRREFVVGASVSLASATAIAAEKKRAEILEFRIAKPKTLHIHDEKTAKSYEKSFKTIGVECKLNGHDGHFDLSFECPKWKQAELKSHEEVEKFTKWLKAIGFETKHSH